MDYYSCVARRTRARTDLYLKTVLNRTRRPGDHSAKAHKSQNKEEERVSWCGSSSKSEVRERKRKRKNATIIEPDDEDVVFVGERESEEQGESVFVGSNSDRMEKRGRFGSRVSEPDLVCLGERNNGEEGDQCEVIEIDGSDGSCSEDLDSYYENSRTDCGDEEQFVVIEEEGGDDKESGRSSYLKKPRGSNLGFNEPYRNRLDDLEFESLGSDKEENGLETNGENSQDLSRTPPSGTEYDSDCLSSSSESEDDDSEDEDYRVGIESVSSEEVCGSSAEEDDDEEEEKISKGGEEDDIADCEIVEIESVSIEEECGSYAEEDDDEEKLSKGGEEDDEEKSSKGGEEDDAADCETVKEVMAATEETKSNHPSLEKHVFSAGESEEKLVTENMDTDSINVVEDFEDKDEEQCDGVSKDDGVPMEECREEKEVKDNTSPICEMDGETGYDGVPKEDCREEEEEKDNTSPICEMDGATRYDGVPKEDCREEDEEKDETNPGCEMNGESSNGGVPKEDCREEGEKDETHPVCEMNGESSNGGVPKEDCRKQEEEKDETNPVCEMNGESSNGGVPKEDCRKEEEEKDETNPVCEMNGESSNGDVPKEDCRKEEKEKDEINPVCEMTGETRNGGVAKQLFSARESKKKKQSLTSSSLRKRKNPSGRSIEKLGNDVMDTARPNVASRKNLKKVDTSNKPSDGGKEQEGEKEAEEDSNIINDEFNGGAANDKEQAKKSVGSSTKLYDEEGKEEEEKENEKREEEKINFDGFSGDGSKKEMLAKEKVRWTEGEFRIQRKRVSGLKDMNVFKLLADSILEKEEEFEYDLFPSREEAHEEDTNRPATTVEPLPLKFTFGIEEIEPVEKSESEKELDMLWAEMEFALKSNEIGAYASPLVDDETNESESGENSATLCHRGKHQLILDEEIGIRCVLCSFVQVEIRYVSPPMEKFPSEGFVGKKISSSEGDVSMFDGIQFQASRSNSEESCKHTEGTVWDIIPGIKSTMYPHQQEGFEYIWNSLAGTIEVDKLKSFEPDSTGGCIISHAPGTGKTRLTIVFLQTYLELYPNCRPVIIAPASLLLTWEEEFKKWNIGVPFHNLNSLEFSGKESVAAVNILDGNRHQCRIKNSIRMVKLFSWNKEKSILGVSYSLFEKLAGEKFIKDKKTKTKSKVMIDKESEVMRMILLDLPGLLVLDEGHTPRNQRSSIWKVLSEVQTKKRIILSGTPFQNNFLELYNTLCLVRPGFADTIPSSLKKLCQRRQIPKKKVMVEPQDSHSSSTGKHADGEINELKALMEPFVHVHKGSILQKNLPGLRDCVVVLNPPDLQKQLLESIHPEKKEKKLLESIQGTSNTFEFEHKLALVSIHPSLCLLLSLSEKEESIIDRDFLERHRLNPSEGIKTRFLIEFIRLCETMNEKVLVFSQFIDPLRLIMDQLHSLLNWSEGEEMLYMCGKLDQKVRQSLINNFNNPNSQAKVLLASTKACSEGINLVGASRVVLLDVVWNPSVERQAISRAYRLGQKKLVYTYHLITRGTTECDKYCKQAEKDRLSELVFSSTNKENEKQKTSTVVSEDKVLDEMIQHDKLKDMFEKIIYQPKESVLVESFGSMAIS